LKARGKKLRGDKSGDLGGQGFGPSRSFLLVGRHYARNTVIAEWKTGWFPILLEGVTVAHVLREDAVGKCNCMAGGKAE